MAHVATLKQSHGLVNLATVEGGQLCISIVRRVRIQSGL